MLAFEAGNFGHEPKTNPIELKPLKIIKQILKKDKKKNISFLKEEKKPGNPE